MDLTDTIIALASAPGGAVRGIIRLSGPRVAAIVSDCWKLQSPAKETPNWDTLRQARVWPGILQLEGMEIPTAFHYWPTARSYTREPVGELHLVGSPPLLELAIRRLCAAGARPAKPGEFTLRAFLAGRIDLTQAEAVLGVIDAHDQRQLRTALAQLAGGIAGPLAQLREQLLDLLAHLEAGLDFVDEDIEFISAAELERQLTAAAEAIQALLGRLVRQSDASSAPRVVLMGQPNAGKSSLFNALAGEEAALVSPQAGTTRDYVATRIQLAGQLVELVDTAGVAEEDRQGNSIASAAQQMTETAAEQAAVRLLCLDGTKSRSAWEMAQLASLPSASLPTIVVLTKGDLAAADQIASQTTRNEPSLPVIVTSSATRLGLDELKSALLSILADRTTELVPQTAVRCRESLRLAEEALARALTAVRNRWGEELAAGELRLALEELGQIVGVVYTNDILDRIFSRFCIGK